MTYQLAPEVKKPVREWLGAPLTVARVDVTDRHYDRDELSGLEQQAGMACTRGETIPG